MEFDKEERKLRTVWRKYLRFEQGEGFLPETKSVGIFCVREISGYAVWYSRHLNEDALGSVPDGDYLLHFFAPESKHIAIEFAVWAAKPGMSQSDAIAALDLDAQNAMKIASPEERKSVFERIN